MAEATMKRKKFNPYPLEPIKPSDEWQKIDRLVHHAQTQFLEAGKLSPIAERIMENYKNQLAWNYTPAGQLMNELIKELDKEDKDGE